MLKRRILLLEYFELVRGLFLNVIFIAFENESGIVVFKLLIKFYFCLGKEP